MHKYLFIILTLIAVACGTPRHAVYTRPQVPQEQRRIATYIFGEASKQYALGNHDAAYELLHQTLRVNPCHAPSLAMLAQYENYLRNREAADSLLALALELDPTNPDFLEANAMLSSRSDDIDVTIDAFERLAAVRPRNRQVLGQLANLYMKANIPDSVVSVLDRIEALVGISEQTANTKHMMRLAMGDTIGGMNELRRLVEEYPHDPNYAVLLGNAYMRVLNQTDSAQIIFDRVAATEPDNARLQIAQLNLYERTDSARYAQYHRHLLYGPSTDSELRSTLILRFIGRHQNDSLGRENTLALFDSVLSYKQEDVRLLSTYVGYLMAVKAGNDTIIPTLDRILEVEPSHYGTLVELLRRHAADNNSEGVSRVCDQAITYYPHESIFYYYSALGHYLVGDTITALDRLTVGCEHINDETASSAAAEMYGMQGDILHSLGRITEAFAAYDSCLIYQPDNISCLNNYAYFLSIEGGDLDKAERMSYRTVRAEPNNRTYLDTYAWILFLQERYEDAAVYMDRVMDGLSPDNPTDDEVSADVFEHAGDIYACLGDIDKALPYWQAAQQLGAKGKTLQQKIKKRKYIKP